MVVQTILGQKISQSQKFLEDGTRIPVTQLWVKGNVLVAVKTPDKHNYSAIQLGFGTKKKANKAHLGQIKGASLQQAPKFLQEIRLNGEDALSLLPVGQTIDVTEVLKPGDIVDVTGISKGKGYAGVVKRHHFKGGPRTHGQSDRERAPGSIGQTTTPGRVYKGKRMAGRMGHQKVTIKNLEIVDVSENTILIKGLVPGGKNTLIMVKKKGENKKFIPLFGKEEKIKGLEDSRPIPGDAQKTDTSLPPQSVSGNTGEINTSRKFVSDDAQQASEQSKATPASLSESRQSESEKKSEINAESTFSSSENESAPSISNSKKEGKKNAS